MSLDVASSEYASNCQSDEKSEVLGWSSAFRLYLADVASALSRRQIGKVRADRLWWRALVLAYVQPR
jgi:hypothetical protein